MRMTNYGKSFRVSSDDPIETKMLFEVGKMPECPRASGILIDDARTIEFSPHEKDVILALCQKVKAAYPGRDGWAFCRMCDAGLRGDSTATT